MEKIKELLEKAKELPEVPGVYIMKNAEGKEIYIGKAKVLRNRVSSYFQKKNRQSKEAALIENINSFDHIETDSELEAFLLESRLIKDFQPKYNVLLKNNEKYPFIELTMGEDFPRILLVWRKENTQSKYYGPFVELTNLRAAIVLLQKIFRIRTCNRKILASDKKLYLQRACLNYHLKRCSGPCCGKIDKNEYRKRVGGLNKFLNGEKKQLLLELKNDMQMAATNLDFETAAELRDLITSLEKIHDQPEVDEYLAPFNWQIDPQTSLKSLKNIANLKNMPQKIEGIDIANLMGKETVGSLVTFIDGQPFKQGYRRYKIKTVQGQDDYASIAEVMRRRYEKFISNPLEMPDIILIDGGKGQLNIAAQVLNDLKIFPKALMSLAEKNETIFLYGKEEGITLSKRNAALRLLMHVRDEAHRFAQHYHHVLRRKALFGENK